MRSPFHETIIPGAEVSPIEVATFDPSWFDPNVDGTNRTALGSRPRRCST